MSRRRSALVAILVGAVCAYAAVRLLIGPPRPVLTDVVQGAVAGVGLAIVTVEVLARVKAINVNGWVRMLGCGAGRPCRSAADRTPDYVMHFPAGGLAPNEAFWSLTLGDSRNRFVPIPLGRHLHPENRTSGP